MKNVLFVGQDPETVDFTDPTLPPGFDATKIRKGIALAMALMKERTWQADECMIVPDENGLAQLKDQLTKILYDCVVIGGGLRIPPKTLLFFEKVINIIHTHAPSASIAFNTHPADTADAAARWIGAA